MLIYKDDMNTYDELQAYEIAFATYRNITVGTARRFMDLGISPRDFIEGDARRLGAITGLKESYFDDERRREALATARKEAAFCESAGIRTALAHTEAYPVRLGECDDAPAMLFSLGNLDPRPKHTVAIVGTRHCTNYGLDFTQRLVKDLADTIEGIVIISGLAYGIDIAAHRAAIKAGVPTGAVLAHGLNTLYPADHRNDARNIVNEGGFLATEYTTDSNIHRGNFLARNRIVAGMADVTVVVESDNKGGAMTTARIAGAYNREVMAAPGRACDQYSRGCNALIARREASIIRDADDLIELMNWTKRATPGQQQELSFLSPDQTVVIDFLTSHPNATVNDLCVHTGLPVQHLSAILFDLEIDDKIVSLPGGRYAPVVAAR